MAIASQKERLTRIRKGYLDSGREGIANTTKLFGGTRTAQFAGNYIARNALDKKMVRPAPTAEQKKKEAEQKAYDKKHSKAWELRYVESWKPPKR